MRVVIEVRTELAGQGTSERRVEIETDGEEAASRVLDPVFIARAVLEVLHGTTAAQRDAFVKGATATPWEGMDPRAVAEQRYPS